MDTAEKGRYTPITVLALAMVYIGGGSDSVFAVTGLIVVISATLVSIGKTCYDGSVGWNLAEYMPTVLVILSLFVTVVHDTTPWYRAFDGTALALAVFGIAGYVVVEAIRPKGQKEVVYAVRDIIYTIASATTSISLLVHLRSLAFLYDDPMTQGNFNSSTSFLKWTTSVSTSPSCSSSQESGNIILSDSVEYAICPRELWKQIRLEAILTTQVFMLYSLTTRMRHEQVGQHKALWIVAAAAECILFSAAVIVQFDNIDTVYTVNRSAVWLALAGGILSLMPSFVRSCAHWYVTNTGAHRHATAWHATAKDFKLYNTSRMRYAKLKL